MKKTNKTNPAKKAALSCLKASTFQDVADGLILEDFRFMSGGSHDLSNQNTLFMISQMHHRYGVLPQPHVLHNVCGYRQWTAKGKRVVKGEKAFYIFVPAKQRKLEGEKQPELQEGEIELTESRQRFVLVPVFGSWQVETIHTQEQAEA